MAFPSDGQNHHKAVKSESSLSMFKEQLEKHYCKKINNIQKIGGTKSKIDNVITFLDGTKVNISLKNKKSIRTGSFDYVNTSSFDWSNVGFSKTKKVYDKFRSSKISSGYNSLKKVISEELIQMNSELLTRLFLENVIEKYNDLSLMIIDEKTNMIYCDVIPRSFGLIKNGGRLDLVKKEGVKMSYSIVGFDKDNNKVDLGLRIRVHLNNGKTKWLNGESSSLVVKFQQDKVYSII